MRADLDPRLHPVRPGCAAAYLRDQIDADTFVDPSPAQVCVPVLNLFAHPGDAALASQLLYGEPVDVYDQRDGHAWVQSGRDGYVGYVDAAGLAAPATEPTARVGALSAPVFAAPGFKETPRAHLPWQATIDVVERQDGFVRCSLGWVAHQHLAETAADDVAAEAERLLGRPYLWGGRSADALDCSALVQLARQACDLPCPRDSDMQATTLGTPVADATPLARGDLIFWDGHVGIMRDPATLLHANIHHMAVAAEPLADAIARIDAAGGGQPTARRRPTHAP